MNEEGQGIRFYCGIGEQQWNHHPVAPGAYACISPVYGKTTNNKQVNRVTVPPGTNVLQDSGAFSDGPRQRLSFNEALRRQESHAARFGYASRIEARASYDLLIDEMWQEDESNGEMVRTKRRWSEMQAEWATEETIRAAAYLSHHRNGLPCVLSAQGVSTRQYLRCAEKILPYLHDGDVFGLGGWCITGKQPTQMLPAFRETMHLVIPFLGCEGVKRIHLWGVCYAPAPGELLWLCDQWNVHLSTDSVGPQIRPVRGRWGYAERTDTHYQRITDESNQNVRVKGYDGSLLCIKEARGIHRAVHVQQVREWLQHFRSTVHYPKKQPQWFKQPQQLKFAFQVVTLSLKKGFITRCCSPSCPSGFCFERREKDMARTKKSSTVQPMYLSIAEVATMLNLGRTKIYDLIKREGLPIIQFGDVKRVPVTKLQRWLEQRESA